MDSNQKRIQLEKRDLMVQFAPNDLLNIRSGYWIRIQSRTGEMILFTSKAPDTGDDLLSPADCLRVIQMYV